MLLINKNGSPNSVRVATYGKSVERLEHILMLLGRGLDVFWSACDGK